LSAEIRLPAGSGNDPVLRAERITAGYGGLPIVSEVSVDVRPGEIVALLGPNGAGKSTFLKSLVGVVRVISGNVFLGDEDITNWSSEALAKRGVGYVPQVGDVFDPLTVAENLDIGGYLLSPSQIPARIQEVCSMFPDLSTMMKRRAAKLSGGERKMLAIARVLMLDPSVLILDEPTANLAPKVIDLILHTYVRRLAESGKSILLVEQRAHAAMEIADRTTVMVSGRIRISGESADLLARADFAELFLGGTHSIA